MILFCCLRGCRLFLSPYDLTPTYKLVHNKFSVKYYLNLVLVDEEDRRYFKQQVPPSDAFLVVFNVAIMHGYTSRAWERNGVI